MGGCGLIITHTPLKLKTKVQNAMKQGHDAGPRCRGKAQGEAQERGAIVISALI